MKIEPCSRLITNLVNDKSFTLKSFKRKVPNRQISKNLTYLDVMAFHQYVDSKRLRKTINIKDINKLYKKEGREFDYDVISYFMKSFGYPKALRPKLEYRSNIDDPMGFSFTNNAILVNENKISDWSRKECLCTFRHEFRHFEQFIDTLRCPDISDEAICLYSLVSAAEDRLNGLCKLHNSYKPNYKFKPLDNYRDCINYYSQHLNDSDLMGKLKIFSAYKKAAVNKIGIIPQGTEEHERSVSIFRELKQQVLSPLGLVDADLIKYHCTFGEYDAYLAQKTFDNQISEDKKCLFSQLKKSNINFINTVASDDKICKKLSNDLKILTKNDENLPINFLNY